MNYKIVNNATMFDIVEIQTDNIIKTFSKQNEARQFLRNLNKGIGFCGWTPSFFLQKFKVPSGIKKKSKSK